MEGLPFFNSGINGKQTKKQTTMKLVKFGIIALTLGLFAASCNNETTTDETTTMDTTTVVAPVTEPAPMMEPAPMDSTMMTADTTTTTTTTVQ